MTEPVYHLTPREDDDHGRLAMAACEIALDHMAQAVNEENRDAWLKAARAFSDAALQCRHACAQLYRRFQRVQLAQGLWPCSSCHNFAPKDEMEKKLIEYGIGEGAKTSTWYVCAACALTDASLRSPEPRTGDPGGGDG